MSLVAYATSSDEDSDGHISDEEDFAPVEVQEISRPTSFTLLLPKPKYAIEDNSIKDKEVDEMIAPAFAKLPLPKSTATQKTVIEEEDDEFLRKKAIPLDGEKQKVSTLRAPVKISIPSLKDFSDVDKERSNKVKPSAGPPSNKKSLSGLLSILPKAKSEQNFAISAPNKNSIKPEDKDNAPKAFAFVPDTVKNRRPAHNTEGVDGIKMQPTKKSIKAQQKTKNSLVDDCSDSDESEDENEAAGDFFSLNADEKLPEVSANEINAMVAKRAAKMAEAHTKYYNAKEAGAANELELPYNEEEMQRAQKRYHEQLNSEALQALVGNSGKRRCKHQENIQIVDISSAEVLPDREEWMRTALASSTTYQPTGVLVDDEPAAGTRRKHQITYLAHKAKANEAELQAMWATNRQNRRATSSKYGF